MLGRPGCSGSTNLHCDVKEWTSVQYMNLQMLWLIQYLIANGVAVCLTGLIYPFPPFRTRKRAALAAAGLFFSGVLMNAMIKSLPKWS